MPIRIKQKNGKWIEVATGNDNGGTIDVDPSLTIEGAAADAKAVGDMLGDIGTILDAINGEVI